MKAWSVVPLGSVLKTYIDAVPSTQLDTANLAGVYGFGRGLFRRGPISPTETTYKVFHRLNAGDFVISSPKAWEGAVARIPDDFDGWFLSPVFPTFRADAKRLDTRFLGWYCRRDAVWRQLQGKAQGMGARRETVSPAQFLSLEIPLPSLAEQQTVVNRLEALTEKTQEVDAHLDAVERDAEHLLALRFRAAIAHAPLRPMSEAAPLVRRDIRIEPEATYTELGVRSFYKGTFHRRTVPGTDFTWQDLYRVHAGDLIFSNIMAWEQAIAIGRPEDHGCVGNHRMLCCEANPEVAVPGFLWYYFTTQEGFDKVYAASPGTAARNRTTTAPALMAIEVPLPSLAIQQTFDQLQVRVAALKTKHAAMRQANAALLPATLERVFAASAAVPS
jgi:type I restriction enzyme, S subunit